ncbi:hypothetical protein [Streptococcus gordonii]|uniref:hypothetical protein n=1 Tax=Streptococcus gordonii TaxID=1302 RepID=UPI001C8BAA4D|nr:hypothetical protein [Streptococcus gordonii]MBX9096722.1 hypothetical protein [Streptococcus gordonii]
MQGFYSKRCKKRDSEDELYFFEGFQGQIEIKKCNMEFQKESETLLVRYANPKLNFDRLRFKKFEYDADTQNDETLSFDSALLEIEQDSERFVSDLSKNKEIYFLPTNLENIIKQIILNKQKKNIPEILKPLIPDDIQYQIEFKFIPTSNSEIITSDKLGEFATSFTKLEEAKNVSEVKNKMDYIKHNFSDSFIDGINDYFIGDIKEGLGMMQRDFEKKYETPSTFHYNFVLRKSGNDSIESVLKILSGDFQPYPFE